MYFPVLAQQTQVDVHTPLMNSGRKISSTHLRCSQLVHLTDIAVYLKPRPPPSPIWVEVKSVLFAAAVVSHTLHYSLGFMSALPLPVSPEPSSFVCVSWSVTAFYVEIISKENWEFTDLFDESLMLCGSLVFDILICEPQEPFSGVPPPSDPT